MGASLQKVFMKQVLASLMLPGKIKLTRTTLLEQFIGEHCFQNVHFQSTVLLNENSFSRHFKNRQASYQLNYWRDLNKGRYVYTLSNFVFNLRNGNKFAFTCPNAFVKRDYLKFNYNAVCYCVLCIVYYKMCLKIRKKCTRKCKQVSL